MDDAAILGILEASDSWNITTGTAAAGKGATADVRDFGAVLARDHTSMRQLGRDMAQKIGIGPGAAPATDDPWRSFYEEVTRELEGLSGAEYDRAFLVREVEYAGDMIDAIKDEYTPAVSNGELKPMLKKIISALESHLRRAEELTKKYPG